MHFIYLFEWQHRDHVYFYSELIGSHHEINIKDRVLIPSARQYRLVYYWSFVRYKGLNKCESNTNKMAAVTWLSHDQLGSRICTSFIYDLAD